MINIDSIDCSLWYVKDSLNVIFSTYSNVLVNPIQIIVNSGINSRIAWSGTSNSIGYHSYNCPSSILLHLRVQMKMLVLYPVIHTFCANRNGTYTTKFVLMNFLWDFHLKAGTVYLPEQPKDHQNLPGNCQYPGDMHTSCCWVQGYPGNLGKFSTGWFVENQNIVTCHTDWVSVGQNCLLSHFQNIASVSILLGCSPTLNKYMTTSFQLVCLNN